MSSWAVQPKRTLLNDPNRNRFSNRDPAFEDNTRSVGPAGYSPRKLLPQVKGSVRMHGHPTGLTERERTISNGVRIETVLPIHALSYAPENFPKPLTPRTNQQDSGRSITKSPRFPKPVTDSERYGCDTPGPGSYVQRIPHVKGNKWSQTRRSVCETIKKEEGHPMVFDDSFRSKQSSYGFNDTYRSMSPGMSEIGSISPSKPAAAVKGGRFGTSIRHLNMHNLNSKVAHEHDQDFDNPPPNRYNNATSPTDHNHTAGNKGKFSPSPRKMDLTKNVSVPGPGSYNVSGSGGDFYAPL